MTSREKRTAGIVGTVIGVVLLYQGVRMLYVDRIGTARETIAKNRAEIKKSNSVIETEESLARKWTNYAERTFSFDRNEAQGGFGKALKEIAKEHGFENAVFSPATGTKIGAQTDITTVAHRISVEGKYSEVINFLRALYKTPFLSQITKISYVPLASKGLRDMVKVDFTIEAPLLPALDAKKSRFFAKSPPQTMTTLAEFPKTPFRNYLGDDERFQLLAERNIFRSYLAPPENVILIDNKDRKMVAVKAQFYWEGRPGEQLVDTVAGKTSAPWKGKGDVVEVTGSYADGTTFGPKKVTFDGGRKDWAVVVDAHSPPNYVDLGVNNTSPGMVFIECQITKEDGTPQNEPKVVCDPGQSNLRVFTDVKSVKLTASYPSGKPAGGRTFSPQEGKQLFAVGPEPAEPVAVEEPVEELPPPEPEIPDDPPDANKKVTALVRYADPKGANNVVQEMIAMGNAGDRTIIRVGEAGAVDGGMLVAVVPALGGVVRMPNSGNYYIYPLGLSFSERVKLEARTEEELPAAIDLWTKR